MKTEYIVVGAVGAAALWICYRSGRRQNFTGLDAMRAGMASYIDSLGDLISPTCCTSCQQAANANAAAASSSSPALPLNPTPQPLYAPGMGGTDPNGLASGAPGGDAQQLQLNCT